MKASEVLKRYQEGEKNFQRVNLRGQSFKGKDLSGADFSEADIRSTNFTDAILREANFTGAECGLQKRWATLWVIFSWLLAGLSGLGSILAAAFVSLIFDSDSNLQVTGLVSLIGLVAFLILIIRQGIRAEALAGAGVVAGIVAVALAGAGVVAVIVAVVFGLAGVVAVAVAVTIAVAVSFVGAFLVAGAEAGIVALVFAAVGVLAVAVVVAVARAKVVAVAVAVAVTFSVAGVYIGWRAMKGDKRDAWIRSFAIAFVATGGTSFRCADLTEANFTSAQLKNTDLRKVILIRVRWFGAKMLDRVRPGDTYLKEAQVQQWLIGKGTDKNFDRKDLRGINLQGANLKDASFVGADLSQANLRDADLSRAKLAQTILERADLTGATLTGACIEDWVISSSTRLFQVKCDYIFMKLSTKEAHDSDYVVLIRVFPN